MSFDLPSDLQCRMQEVVIEQAIPFLPLALVSRSHHHHFCLSSLLKRMDLPSEATSYLSRVRILGLINLRNYNQLLPKALATIQGDREKALLWLALVAIIPKSHQSANISYFVRKAMNFNLSDRSLFEFGKDLLRASSDGTSEILESLCRSEVWRDSLERQRFAKYIKALAQHWYSTLDEKSKSAVFIRLLPDDELPLMVWILRLKLNFR